MPVYPRGVTDPETHDHQHQHASGHAGLLDLDAEVVGHLDELTAWTAGHVRREPRVVVDVGAGTGTGAFALARRFSHAQLVAVDRSAEVLEHLRAAALEQGLDDRLRVVQADLDAGWPDVRGVDLAWAASSMHHVADPERVFTDLHAALEPGGLLVVVEMDGLPRFLPDDLGLGAPGLEDRCRTAMARARWNEHPDWAPHLQRAGFEVLEQRTSAFERHPAPPAASRYAHGVFSRMRTGLADLLEAEDLRTIDRLLVEDAPESLLRRGDLGVRSERTAWAARRV